MFATEVAVSKLRDQHTVVHGTTGLGKSKVITYKRLK